MSKDGHQGSGDERGEADSLGGLLGNMHKKHEGGYKQSTATDGQAAQNTHA